MKAGRELDALVAEKVMGLELESGWRVSPGYGDCDYASDHEQEDSSQELIVAGDYSVHGIIPAYSTDIAAAWVVVEKLGLLVMPLRVGWLAAKEDGYCDLLVNDYTMDGHIKYSSSADTAPLAICLAALKAVQGSSGSYDASSADGEISKPIAGEST